MIKAFILKLAIIKLLSSNIEFLFVLLLIIPFAAILLLIINEKLNLFGPKNFITELNPETAHEMDGNQTAINMIEGVTDNEDLLVHSRNIIKNYQHPRDFEHLYDRLWHFLRWQQFNQEDRVLDTTRDLHRLFIEVSPVDARVLLYNAIKERVHIGEFSPSSFLNFLYNELDEGLVSTAALDILNYSGLDINGYLKGSQILFESLFQKLTKCPGAVFGGALAFGDARQVQSLKAMVPCLSPADFEVAARQQTGFANHASIQFWIAFAFANVDGDDATSLSVTGSAASALVLARRRVHEPIVAEIERLFPTDPKAPRINILQQWDFDQYALWASDALLELESRERVPKVFSIVLQEWGLTPRSPTPSSQTYQ